MAGERTRVDSTSPRGGTRAPSPKTQGIDPKEAALLARSLTAPEQGPTNRAAASFVNWEQLYNELGSPFDAEHIPFSKLRQMRRDPMIAFGLHYIKTPLVRAPWRIECEDAQIAGFIDAALRPIYARLIFQYCNSLDFGFSAIAKRFKQEVPFGTYIDPEDTSGEPQPVWSEGSVLPWTWTPFVALPPEKCKPVWVKKTGEFNGIKFENDDDEAGGKKKSKKEDDPDIDIYHALWATNEKDSVFGSLYGYPRIAHAYNYWWTDRFNSLLADRYTERMAVPPMIGYYPEGESPLGDGDDAPRISNMDLMLEALSRIRSGGVVALPSDIQETIGGDKASNARQWAIEFLTGGEANIDFDEKHQKMAVMKLRALFVPEQTFLEGEGGTSSRNVAAQMAEVFTQSQTNLMIEIDDHINRFVIPQLVAVNFPEFLGRVRKVTTGFSSDDVSFMKQIIQLVGQEDFTQLGVDVPALMERLQIPMLSPAQIAQKQQELIDQSVATTPALTEPEPGAAGVIETEGVAAGFSYIQPRQVINLSADAAFLSDLPNSPHFSDKKMRVLAASLRKAYKDAYKQQYTDFADYLETIADSYIELSDDNSKARKLAERIVNGWKIPAKLLKYISEVTVRALKDALKRAAAIEAKRAKIEARITDEQLEEWSNERVGYLLNTTEGTVREQLTGFVAARLEDGKTPREIADEMRTHFTDFPDWQARRIARTETQTAYNVGTVMAARSAGLKQVQAHDASDGEDTDTDEECLRRDGKIFSLAKALQENEEEHPNGTLYFTVVPRADLSVEYVDDATTLARFDDDTSTIYLSSEITPEQESAYMKSIVPALIDNE